MGEERKSGLWKGVLALYLVSFVLPFERSPGVLVFGMALLWGFFQPIFFAYWIANPLLWFGLAAYRRGRYGWAAAFGTAALGSASLPLIVLKGAHTIYPEALWRASAYYAWLASMACLAAIGVAGWLGSIVRTRPQFRLKTLMLVVLAAAPMLAAAAAVVKSIRAEPTAVRSRGMPPTAHPRENIRGSGTKIPPVPNPTRGLSDGR